MFCLEPLILAGYLFTLLPNRFHTTNLDGGFIEAQTCQDGVGAHVKASSSGLYGAGLHYGMSTDIGWMKLTVQPFVGFSYVDHPVHELPQRTQFEVGGSVHLSYRQSVFAIEYWHLSNAGMTDPNIGKDMIAFMTGWRF